MKKFQFMLLALATVALFSCEKKPQGGGHDDDDPVITFNSLIAVDDYTMDDWKEVPSEYLVKLKQQGETMMGGLDSIWVYADKAYLNLLVWYRTDSLIKSSKEIVPFHIYLNADGDNKTGGYDDWFLDGNAEYLLEGFLFEGNAPCRFNPAVFHWWGSMGGGITDQTTKTGWLWTDPSKTHDESDGWGADIPTGTQDVAFSQPLEGNKVFEIQIVRSMITSNWANKFGIGFDIERVAPTEQTEAPWEIFGILPNPTYDEGGAKVTAKKPDITIDPNDH